MPGHTQFSDGGVGDGNCGFHAEEAEIAAIKANVGVYEAERASAWATAGLVRKIGARDDTG